MRHLPCDELGADLFEAGIQWGCRLYVGTALNLIEYIGRHYPTNDFEGLLEKALDGEPIENENERHGYKMALGMFYGKRAQYAKQCDREMDAVPFSPR